MVPADLVDAAGGVGERLTVRRQHGFDREPADPAQRLQIIAQRVRARLGMEAYVGADLGQQVVAREEQTPVPPVETAVAGRMAWRPDRQQLAGRKPQALRSFQQRVGLDQSDELARSHGGGLEELRLLGDPIGRE